MFLSEVTHRGVTTVHYLENKKYMLWYHKKGDPGKTVGFVQVRGIHEPLTDDEIRTHIDKLWERYYKEQEKKDDRENSENHAYAEGSSGRDLEL